MSALRTEKVLSVRHWSDQLFSFTTTRDPGFRFESGHFVMLGMNDNARPLMRAYSIASPAHADELEFLSIKVPDGKLTSRLQAIEPGQHLLVSSKPVGTLVIRDVRPGRVLYLLATGTGLAPFLSIVQDPETYEKFEKIVVVHGVRTTGELAFAGMLEGGLQADPYIGDEVAKKLLYYPTVTREAFRNTGRIPDLMRSGKIFADLGLPALDPALDRAMICGSLAMLRDTAALLTERGLEISPGCGEPGDFVIERAFAER